jgi:hypothetical protein
MNELEIESVLRRAPRPAAPAGLLERLKEDIVITPERVVEKRPDLSVSWLRRWLPAMALSSWLIACLVVLGVQTNMLSQLRQENRRLRTEAQARAAVAEQKAVEMRAVAQQLERLRAENQEVTQLQTQVAQLAATLQELDGIRRENQQLASSAKSRSNTPAGSTQPDFFASTAQRASRIKCVNNLKQLGLAARIWAHDHGEVLPSDHESLVKHLKSPTIVYCPDGEGTVPFEILAPGVNETEPQVVYARCPIHNNVVTVDGAAWQLAEGQLIVRPDGKTVMGPKP